MESKSLSPELINFIATHLDSLRQLEALLLLHADPKMEWSAKGAAHALSANERATLRWLEAFVQAGLAMESKSSKELFKYQPANSKTEEMITLLAKEYRLRPLKVIDVIINKPTQKMMSFMEAFKIKKGDADDDC